MTVNEKLNRLASMMSPTKLAKASGLKMTTVFNYISGKSVPSAQNVLPIARALGVDVHWLLDDRAGWPPVYAEDPNSQPTAA